MGAMTAMESVVMSAVINGNRIELRKPDRDALNEFCASLPGAKWDRKKFCWTCHITPACCWRITSQAPCRVEAEEKIVQLAHRFYDPVLRPTTEMTQPEVRNKDAWRHQVAAFHFAFRRDASMLAMSMGTGKSLVTIQLLENWRCRRVLILCPVAVRGVWRREFSKHAVNDWHVTVLENGTVAKKVAKAEQEMNLAGARGQMWVLVVNYETAKCDAFAVWSMKHQWDALVCDESHRCKSATSQTSKYVAEVSKDAKRRLALTGTPMAHSPLDLFGQFRFLDRGVFGDSYHRFRNMFAISGPFGADHIVGFKNQDEMARRMSLITYQVGADVLDLPEATHAEIPVKLEPATRKVYDSLETELIAQVGDGEITAANGLVKLLRCQQITGGHARLDDGSDNTISTEKADALSDLLEDLNEPVVVACQFRHDLKMVEQVATKLKRTYGEVSGSRKDLTEHSTMPEGIDVLGLQTASGGVGIDLTRSRVMVIFSPGFNLGQHEQLLARINRPGQTKPVVFYYLIAEDSVDEVVYKSLQKKRDVIDEVLYYLKGKGE